MGTPGTARAVVGWAAWDVRDVADARRRRPGVDLTAWAADRGFDAHGSANAGGWAALLAPPTLGAPDPGAGRSGTVAAALAEVCAPLHTSPYAPTPPGGVRLTGSPVPMRYAVRGEALGVWVLRDRPPSLGAVTELLSTGLALASGLRLRGAG